MVVIYFSAKTPTQADIGKGRRKEESGKKTNTRTSKKSTPGKERCGIRATKSSAGNPQRKMEGAEKRALPKC